VSPYRDGTEARICALEARVGELEKKLEEKQPSDEKDGPKWERTRKRGFLRGTVVEVFVDKERCYSCESWKRDDTHPGSYYTKPGFNPEKTYAPCAYNKTLFVYECNYCCPMFYPAKQFWMPKSKLDQRKLGKEK